MPGPHLLVSIHDIAPASAAANGKLNDIALL